MFSLAMISGVRGRHVLFDHDVAESQRTRVCSRWDWRGAKSARQVRIKSCLLDKRPHGAVASLAS